MRAYKGFTPDLMSRLGGKPVQFKVGETYEEPRSKTADSGFHCCENPFECLTYYSFGSDRFCLVEATGDIDEDDNERISCTKLKVLKELSEMELFLAGVAYMIQHPERKKWEQSHKSVTVAREYAEAMKAGQIAIARGDNPAVEAVPGAYIALIRDTQADRITAWADVAQAAGTYSLNEAGEAVFAARKAVKK